METAPSKPSLSLCSLGNALLTTRASNKWERGLLDIIAEKIHSYCVHGSSADLTTALDAAILMLEDNNLAKDVENLLKQLVENILNEIREKYLKQKRGEQC